jgi:predicted small metal-binding protein
MGDVTCNFVAKGETDHEVVDMMMAHVKEKHADVMKNADMGQMKSKMMSKIKTE